MINESLLRFFNGFHHNAHPMAMVSGVVASMSAFYHDTTDIHMPHDRDVFAHRIIAKLPTIAAAAYKHSKGQPFVYPLNSLDYCSNTLHMFFSVPSDDYEVDPVAAQALDLLFILHADHEQNCSTSTVRLAGSSGTNPYAAIAAGISALWGPAHGGANEAVINMLEDIGTANNIPKYIDRAKDGSDPFRLMGFGHRVYKNHDPRATIIRKMCHRLLERLRANDTPLFDLALSLRRSRSRTTTSSRKTSIQCRLLLGHHLSGARHPEVHVHRHVRDRKMRGLGHALARDGPRIPARGSVGRGSSTSVRTSATIWRSTSGAKRSFDEQRADPGVRRAFHRPLVDRAQRRFA